MYIPQPEDEGLALYLVALRDYLAADPAVIELLPSGAAGIIPEGDFREDTPTPVIMPAMGGDGGGGYGRDVQLVRLILYVLDRGRGNYAIERILSRIRRRINDTEAALAFFTFPPGERLQVWSIEAKGGTASTSFPNWRAEGRGLYVFAHVGGLDASD